MEKLKNKFGNESKPGSKNVGSKEKEKNASSPIHIPVAVFEWMVGDISSLQLKRKTISSTKLKSSKLSSAIKLWLSFKSQSTIMMTVYMYPHRIYDLISGDVVLTIQNAENPKLYLSMKQNFQKYRRSLSLDFGFNYNELLVNKVFQADRVIIKCSFGRY